MTREGGTDDGLDGLPADARRRLDAFTRAVDRIDVDRLRTFAAEPEEPRHQEAIDTAELVAIESGLVPAVEAARRVVVEALIREFGARQYRVWVGGIAMAPNVGPVEERVAIARSLADAVTAMVLGTRLDPDDVAELLGLWARLLPGGAEDDERSPAR
jgi:hypothetical protein